MIHLERVWAENRFTAEGQALHQLVDKGGSRKIRGMRRAMALPLASKRLNIAGVADLVEFLPGATGEAPYPVEYKRGKAKLHRADEVQLCAQALCLEEMTGRCVPEGALFYAETKRRLTVLFDDDLRCLTRDTIAALAEIFESRVTPPPTVRKQRCRACSLIELCRPDAVARPVKIWRNHRLAQLLADDSLS